MSLLPKSTTGKALTPKWLTSLLQQNGSLRQARVTTIAVVSSEVTFTSHIYRLNISYSIAGSDHLPRRLFLKVPRADVDPEITSGFGREVEFYNQTAPTLPASLPTIRCYGASYESETGVGHLFLKDVSPTHIGCEWPLPPDDSQCEAAIAYLARLHAAYWQNDLLDKFPVQQTNVGPVIKRGRAFLKFLSRRLCVADSERYAKALECLATQWHGFTSTRPRTFLLGDAHFSNFLYPRRRGSNAVLPCDWQYWQAGPPAFDLSYMIALNLHSQRRQRLEKPLLERYYEVLRSHHVDSYSWTDLLRDYRLFLYRHLLIVPAWQWSLGVPATVWWSHVERGMAAWRDLECDEFLHTS